MKYDISDAKKGILTPDDCEVGDFIVFTDKNPENLGVEILMISSVDPEDVNEYLEGRKFKLVSLGKQSKVLCGTRKSIKELVTEYINAWDDMNYRIVKSNDMLLTEINKMKGVI